MLALAGVQVPAVVVDVLLATNGAAVPPVEGEHLSPVRGTGSPQSLQPVLALPDRVGAIDAHKHEFVTPERLVNGHPVCPCVAAGQIPATAGKVSKLSVVFEALGPVEGHKLLLADGQGEPVVQQPQTRRFHWDRPLHAIAG